MVWLVVLTWLKSIFLILNEIYLFIDSIVSRMHPKSLYTIIMTEFLGFMSSTRIDSPIASEGSFMTFSSRSRWYLNGLPKGILVSVIERFKQRWNFF